MRFAVLVVAGFVLATVGSARAQSAPELKPGDLAPDFALQGTDGKVHRLADYTGKRAVVLAWFPKAFTKGCTIECKSLAANGDKIRQFEVAYFMASVDKLEENKAFADQERADFPLLSDPDKKVAEAYGVLSERGTANRWTFYVGKDRKILAIDKEVKPATSAEDMIAKLKELRVGPSTE